MIFSQLIKIRKNHFFKRGQTLVEYAIIIAMISIVAIVVLQAMGSKVQAIYSKVNGQLDASQSGS